MMLREKIIEQCLQAMKREDVKKELKQMFHPVIDMIMQEIYPYIYLSVVFVMISFLLTLSIFILMMRTSYFMPLPCMNAWMDEWMNVQDSDSSGCKINVVGWPPLHYAKTIHNKVNMH